jgi:hypothetical protein
MNTHQGHLVLERSFPVLRMDTKDKMFAVNSNFLDGVSKDKFSSRLDLL